MAFGKRKGKGTKRKIFSKKISTSTSTSMPTMLHRTVEAHVSNFQIKLADGFNWKNVKIVEIILAQLKILGLNCYKYNKIKYFFSTFPPKSINLLGTKSLRDQPLCPP